MTPPVSRYIFQRPSSRSGCGPGGQLRKQLIARCRDENQKQGRSDTLTSVQATRIAVSAGERSSRLLKTTQERFQSPCSDPSPDARKKFDNCPRKWSRQTNPHRELSALLVDLHSVRDPCVKYG